MAVIKKKSTGTKTKQTATKPKPKTLVRKKTAKAPVKAKPASTKKAASKSSAMKNKSSKTESKKKVQGSEPVRVVNRISPPRSVETKRSGRAARAIHQYNYMKAPGTQNDFHVGDKVEVYCDHEQSRERVRGWIGGIVVQVDNKLVAVQFRSNVYLTDGWMVPDRILWYSLTSEHIRSASGARKTPPAKKVVIPDY